MTIRRSETGGGLHGVGASIFNINGQIAAEVTATQLVIHHPNTGTNDSSAGLRPAGSLSVTPGSTDFGEVVLGGPNPALVTATRTVTLTNDGDDCISVSTIADNAPYTLTAASRAKLPIELDFGKSETVDIVFAPTAPGNNVSRSLQVTRAPANGASTIDVVGDARTAEPRVAVSRASIGFGTVVHPSSVTQSFTISNTGDLDLDVSISPSPAGAFSWSPAGATQPLPVSGAPITVAVTFTTPGDMAAISETITVNPSIGTARTVSLTGAGCVANAVPSLPPATAINFGQVERGFRTVRTRTVSNLGDGDLVVTARILPGADPTHQSLFGLVQPGADVTATATTRSYPIPPTTRCGPGPTGTGSETIAVSFFADAAPGAGPYTAVLELATPAPGPTTQYTLTVEITPAVPLDAVLVFDRSGSMGDVVGTRTKLEAARAAGELFIQLLREDANDRAAIISFNESPTDDFPIASVAGSKPAMIAALGFADDGATNVAGGVILATDEFTDPPHPDSPPNLKRAIVVLTDGMENRCFQVDGAGAWYSITGRDAADGMRRPDSTPQDTQVLPVPTGGVEVYSIGIGEPVDIDATTLELISTATNGTFSQARDLTGMDFFRLEKYYTQIFMETTGLAPISDPFYMIGPGDRHTHEFDVFPGDVSAMVVIYDHPDGRLPFKLVSPAGEEFSGVDLPPGFGLRVRSTTTARFVELRFPKGEPDRYASNTSHRWQVVVEHSGEVCHGDINPPDDNRELFLSHGLSPAGDGSVFRRPGFLPTKCRPLRSPIMYGFAIGAGSNLRMQSYVEPGLKLVGESIRLDATIAEAGLSVPNAIVTAFLTSPNGSVHEIELAPDVTTTNGSDYTALFTQTSVAGQYDVLFRSNGVHSGQTFVRELHRTKAVFARRPPDGDGGSGTDDDCCRQLLREIRQLNGQEEKG